MTLQNDTKILLALAYDKITQTVKLTHISILSVAEVRSIALNIIFIQLVRPDTFYLMFTERTVHNKTYRQLYMLFFII